MIQLFIDKRTAREKDEGGFTLIELLVVIIILAILAAVTVFAVGGVGDKGNAASCVIDTRTLRTALEAHFANFSDYTATPADLTAPGTAARTAVDEAVLVSRGFLSEVSSLHNANVYDTSAAAGVTPAIEITVQDGTSPGGDCGNEGEVTGTTAADGTKNV